LGLPLWAEIFFLGVHILFSLKEITLLCPPFLRFFGAKPLELFGVFFFRGGSTSWFCVVFLFGLPPSPSMGGVGGGHWVCFFYQIVFLLGVFPFFAPPPPPQFWFFWCWPPGKIHNPKKMLLQGISPRFGLGRTPGVGLPPLFFG